mgnify:FL=1
MTFTRLTGQIYRRTQTVSKQTERQREELRRAELRKFVKDCERLYEQNRERQRAKIIPFPRQQKERRD